VKRYINYFIYVIKHKYFVFLAGLKFKISIWQLLCHDIDKFKPNNFIAYAKNFFNEDGTKRNIRDKTGAYDPNSQPLNFKKAWLNHQRNKHHWQAWISIGDNGNLDVIPMPIKYIKEMIADWEGAGRAISGVRNPTDWYVANYSKMVLHKVSILIIEELLYQTYTLSNIEVTIKKVTNEN
jgi:hypothetical protein